MKPQHLSALWFGGELSSIELICLRSMLETGHEVALYTYKGVSNAPNGVDQRDARRIMPLKMMIKDNAKHSYALGSDLFRYRLLQRDFGTCWTDCDMLFIKALQPADYIFGWERPDSICNAILKLPANSPILSGILDIAESKAVSLPWWSKTKQRRNWIKSKLGMGRDLGSLPWGAIGPRAVTYFATKQCIASLARPAHVFYPNPATLAGDVFDPAANVGSRIRFDTVAIHLWNTEIRDLKSEAIQDGCFLSEWANPHAGLVTAE